jgi:hypothetical protein
LYGLADSKYAHRYSPNDHVTFLILHVLSIAIDVLLLQTQVHLFILSNECALHKLGLCHSVELFYILDIFQYVRTNEIFSGFMIYKLLVLTAFSQ